MPIRNKILKTNARVYDCRFKNSNFSANNGSIMKIYYSKYIVEIKESIFIEMHFPKAITRAVL